MQQALLLDGNEFMDRNLRISRAIPKKAKSMNNPSKFQGKQSGFTNSNRIKRRIDKRVFSHFKLKKGKKQKPQISRKKE